MTPFPKQRVSLRRADQGRAVLEGECAFGLVIVPVRGVVKRLAPMVLDHAGRPGGGDTEREVAGFTLHHMNSGLRLLPDGWFFTRLNAARAALTAIGARWPTLFTTRDINQFLPLAGPVMAICRDAHVVAGKWNDLSAVRIDEDEWTAGAARRAEMIAALRDNPSNVRRNEEAA